MKKEFKRVYILGCSGSGKTTLAKELARKLYIQHYDLDDIFWKKKYTIKRDEKSCRSLLKKLAVKDSWIIEGVYDRWVDPAVRRATFVIWLRISPLIITLHLLQRYIFREKTKESWKDTLMLIRYVWRYEKEDQPSGFGSHKKLIEKYKVPYIKIKKEKEAKYFLKKATTSKKIKELFGAIRFNKSTEDMLKEERKLTSKWE